MFNPEHSSHVEIIMNVSGVWVKQLMEQKLVALGCFLLCAPSLANNMLANLLANLLFYITQYDS